VENALKTRNLFPLLVAVAMLASCDRGAPVPAGADAESEKVGDGEPEYTFEALEYPGANSTVASDISDDGTVVGWFVDSAGMHGFVYQAGTFTPVRYPGAVRTQLAGIGADGTTVGAYRREGEAHPAFHGFLRTPAGEFVEIRHPDHPYSMAQRVLGDGTIVGCYHGDDATTSMRGIIVRNGSITVHEVVGSMINGGTPDGRRLVGNLSVEGTGFVSDGADRTSLQAPDASLTEIWDINSSNVMVGAVSDTAGDTRGFVHRNGRWTVILPPGAQSGVAFGINERGQIVGGFIDESGVRRGYIATRKTPD
jgi:probable HAF family extracellular repeat protein